MVDYVVTTFPDGTAIIDLYRLANESGVPVIVEIGGKRFRLTGSDGATGRFTAREVMAVCATCGRDRLYEGHRNLHLSGRHAYNTGDHVHEWEDRKVGKHHRPVCSRCGMIAGA